MSQAAVHCGRQLHCRLDDPSKNTACICQFVFYFVDLPPFSRVFAKIISLAHCWKLRFKLFFSNNYACLNFLWHLYPHGPCVESNHTRWRRLPRRRHSCWKLVFCHMTAVPLWNSARRRLTCPAAGCRAASRRASSDCAATASESASRLEASHSWKQIWCAAACGLRHARHSSASAHAYADKLTCCVRSAGGEPQLEADLVRRRRVRPAAAVTNHIFNSSTITCNL